MAGGLAARLLAVAALAGFVAGCQAAGGAEAVSPMADSDAALPQSLRDAAATAERQGNLGSAVRYYRRIHTLDPADVPAATGLMRSLRNTGRTPEAVRVGEAMDERGEATPEVMAELGKSYLANGDVRRALETLRGAVETGYGAWHVHSALGIVYDRLGDHVNAQYEYRRALEKAPDHPSVRNNLALSLALSGKLEEAIEQLEAIRYAPEVGPQARTNLALLYTISGDIERARKLLRHDLSAERVERSLAYLQRFAETGAGPGVGAGTAEGATSGLQALPSYDLTDVPRAPASDGGGSP